MKNLKVRKVKGTSIGFVEPGRKREVKRAYLKKFAVYLDSTLPEPARTYTAPVKSLIKGDGKFTGGELALQRGLITKALIQIFYNESVEKFQERKEVIVVAVKTYPVNFFRRLKRSKDLLQTINNIKTSLRLDDLRKDPETSEEDIASIEEYFNFLNNCLVNGLVPVLNLKSE